MVMSVGSVETTCHGVHLFTVDDLYIGRSTPLYSSLPATSSEPSASSPSVPLLRSLVLTRTDVDTGTGVGRSCRLRPVCKHKHTGCEREGQILCGENYIWTMHTLVIAGGSVTRDHHSIDRTASAAGTDIVVTVVVTVQTNIM